MTPMSVETDTYGRVKAVSGTPVLTKFAMLQFLLVYPPQTLYFVKAGPSSATTILFIGRTHFATVVGIPLSTLDKPSVVMAYVRGIFAALTICGVAALISGITYLTGEHLDGFAMIVTRRLFLALVTGIVGGNLS